MIVKQRISLSVFLATLCTSFLMNAGIFRNAKTQAYVTEITNKIDILEKIIASQEKIIANQDKTILIYKSSRLVEDKLAANRNLIIKMQDEVIAKKEQHIGKLHYIIYGLLTYAGLSIIFLYTKCKG